MIVGAAAAVAVLAAGVIPVAAAVIGDPLGLVQIATSGDNANGSVLAVSTGGCASNGTRFATVPVAVSGTGCSSSFGTAISGTGSASGGPLGVSATGYSSGVVALSGEGRPTGTYAVSGNHEVVVEGNPIVGNSGVAPVPSPPTLLQLQSTAAKEQQLALDMPTVLENLALNAHAPAFEGRLTTPMSLPVGPAFHMNDGDQHPPAAWAPTTEPLTNQKRDWSCGSASTELFWWYKYGSDPGESTFYDEQNVTSDGTHTGTSTGQIAESIDKHEGGIKDMGQSQQYPDANTLLGMVEFDMWRYSENVIVNVDTGGLPNWHQHDFAHFDALFGWDSNSGGHIDMAEEYRATDWWANGSQWNPYGYWQWSSSIIATAVDNSPDHNAAW